jgi:hypothetical protein
LIEQGGTLEFFGPLLDESSKIKREAVRRRKQFDEKSIIAEEIPEYEAEGWQVDIPQPHLLQWDLSGQ